ncbi:MAG: BamA/TamA family outer membrane protein [Candidatus Azobacteroides sp.]|nr:BamA/TamA family outer membrane protein [Candidatus Azobacteroides sp.]
MIEIRNSKYQFVILILILIGVSGCNYTKNLAPGQYLLDNVDIVSDNKNISPGRLEGYVLQKPNSSILGLKPGLGIYNLAGTDSTFFNKLLWKIGSAPVIYNAANSKYSADQMEQQLFNWGYLNAEVDYTDKLEDKKAKVTYMFHPGDPYRIRNFSVDIQDSAKYRIMQRALRRNPIRPNSIFDQDALEDRLIDINTAFRNVGYFSLGTEYFQYQADTALNNLEVDLTLTILPRTMETDSGAIYTQDHLPYRIERVDIYSGSSLGRRRRAVTTDTTSIENIFIHYDQTRFLNERTILNRCFIRPGRRYSERLAERTYQALNSLSSVRQVTMGFTEKPDNLLDCNINITQGNIHWIQGTIEGTNAAGDLGIGATVGYQHRNIFNGAEIFRVRLRGAYEAITGSTPTDILNQDYYEYGIELGLSFPRFLVKLPNLRERQGSTDIRFSINNQLRAEYQRIFFNTGYTYKWVTSRNKLSHTWDVFDLNYVTMPKVSELFQDSVLNNPNNTILRYSYENQFILRAAYGLVINSQGRNQRHNEYQVIRTNIEFAGNLLYGISKLFHLRQDENGYYEIFNNPFAQYVKGDVDFAKSIGINTRSSIVFHAGLGVAYPYLNSIVLPYEKRYFSGGSNSVRGWNTRQLGPGSYNNHGVTDFMNQSGDIKLDLNIEYRNRVAGMFQVAAFIDAGNIWTIRNYENQPNGEFKFDRFYKEIALGTGLGIRLDFDFFLIRFDAGIKVYDPALTGTDKWRLAHFKFNDDFAFHFAIGYPF